MTHAVCTVGYPGAGKTAAQEPAEALGIPVVVMGNRVRERATNAFEQGEHDIEYETKSEFIGKWATAQRDKHGDAVVADWTVDYVQTNVDSEQVFIDGMRSVDELAVFEEAFDSVLVIYVEASPETRLERLQTRGRDGEETFTMDDLRERDAREDDWGVASVVEEADVTIPNEESLEAFEKRVRETLENEVLPT